GCRSPRTIPSRCTPAGSTATSHDSTCAPGRGSTSRRWRSMRGRTRAIPTTGAGPRRSSSRNMIPRGRTSARTISSGRRRAAPTWTAIGRGLPRAPGSLTVFEDPRNARLVWVGTATGVYVTTDGGKAWRRFGKNLPATPVEGMALSYAQRDLVVSTHGRGIWITNVAPLEEVSDSLFTTAAHLFGVPPAYQYRQRDTHPDFGSRPFVGPNQPRGAVIAYYLKNPEPDGIKLAVTTVAGD